VARHTAATVRSQVLEKGIAGCVRRSTEIQIGKGSVGVRELLKPAHNLV